MPAQVTGAYIQSKELELVPGPATSDPRYRCLVKITESGSYRVVAGIVAKDGRFRKREFGSTTITGEAGDQVPVSIEFPTRRGGRADVLLLRPGDEVPCTSSARIGCGLMCVIFSVVVIGLAALVVALA